MAVQVTFASNVEAQLNATGFKLAPLKQDLELYFGSNKSKIPHYLCKDTPYRDPAHIQDSEIHHIHIFVEGSSCPNDWSSGRNRTSNSYIVYTFGYFDEEAVHIIDFLSQQAHERSRANHYSLMTKYKVEADSFRSKC